MIDKRRFLSNFISGIKRTTTSDCKSAFVFVFVAGGRQVYIELVVEALLIILSYVDVTSDLSTMPVQVVAGR
jgi:hypothetical protein